MSKGKTEHERLIRSASTELVKSNLKTGRDYTRYPVETQFNAVRNNVEQLQLHLAQAVRNGQLDRVQRIAKRLGNQLNTLDVLAGKLSALLTAEPSPVDTVEMWKGHVVHPDLSVNYSEMVRKYGPQQQRFGIKYVNGGSVVTPKNEPLWF